MATKAKAELTVTQGFIRVSDTEAGAIEADDLTGEYLWNPDGSDSLIADELRAIADLMDKLEADRK